MNKRKRFRRAKVWDVVPGKRLRMFSKPAPRSQAFGNLGKETALDADIIQGGKQAQHDN